MNGRHGVKHNFPVEGLSGILLQLWAVGCGTSLISGPECISNRELFSSMRLLSCWLFFLTTMVNFLCRWRPSSHHFISKWRRGFLLNEITFLKFLPEAGFKVVSGWNVPPYPAYGSFTFPRIQKFKCAAYYFYMELWRTLHLGAMLCMVKRATAS